MVILESCRPDRAWVSGAQRKERLLWHIRGIANVQESGDNSGVFYLDFLVPIPFEEKASRIYAAVL